jgi:hypothetical protein
VTYTVTYKLQTLLWLWLALVLTWPESVDFPRAVWSMRTLEARLRVSSRCLVLVDLCPCLTSTSNTIILEDGSGRDSMPRIVLEITFSFRPLSLYVIEDTRTPVLVDHSSTPRNFGMRFRISRASKCPLLRPAIVQKKTNDGHETRRDHFAPSLVLSCLAPP